MRTLFIRFYAVLLLVTLVPLLIGCEEGAVSGSSASVDSEVPTTESPKIAYYSASYDEVAAHVVDCPGNSNNICVTICHRPPGNPTNSKTMVKTLKAANAHLNHGGPHEHQDYLGACHAEDEESDDDGSGDDGSGDDGSGDDGSGDDGSGDDGSGDDGSGDDGSGDDGSGDDGSGDGDHEEGIPTWCEPFINIDSDCDGIADETGELIF